VQGVLRHLQTAGGHTTCIGRFARSVKNLVFNKNIDPVRHGRHVGPFAHRKTTVLDERFGIVKSDFVLCRTRERHVTRHTPGTLAFEVFGPPELIAVLANTTALAVLEFHDPGQLLGRDPLFVHNGAIGIGQRNHFAAKLIDLLNRVLRHIARARDQHRFALEAVTARGQHFLCKISGAITRGLRSHQRTTPIEPLARQHSRKFIGQFFVLSKQKTDFPAAHTNVTGRNVCVGPNVTIQFVHERMAKPHDLVIALALGIEISTPLATAHG